MNMARSGIAENGYRQLSKLFELISEDNGGCTADEIERALANVPDADLETLAMGEHFDQLRVKRGIGAKHGEDVVEALEQLLNVAFQGPLKPSDFSPEDHEPAECQCHRATGTGPTPWCPVHGESSEVHMTESESKVRCNRCGLWKVLSEIAHVLLSGGICKSCLENTDGRCIRNSPTLEELMPDVIDRHKRMPKYIEVGKSVYFYGTVARVTGIRGPLVEFICDDEPDYRRHAHYSWLSKRPSKPLFRRNDAP